ncbi:MAG: 2-methylaconitate cis-trans isomerase PrpF family protein [Armatimonadota bacterium]
MTQKAQVAIPSVVMRGGTSRGVFFHRKDLPGPGELRDRIILSVFGSPDPYGRQIDGLGGATSTTSKVVIVGPSSEPGCDIDYFFGQVDVRRPLVDYTGSCGNLSAAVGPFAIEERLIATTDPVTVVRIWQVNTRKRIIAHVPTAAGAPQVEGDFAIDGIPSSGARIRLDYLSPGGSVARDFLPTGRAVDTLDIPGIGRLEVSLVDATNPVVIFRASDLGLRGDELAYEIDTRPDLLQQIEAVRGHGAVAMGLADSPEEATQRRPGTPKVAFVSPPSTYHTQRGTPVNASEVTLNSRIMSMGALHRTHAVTGAVAVAAAALVHESIVHRVSRLPGGGPEQEIRLGHPSGILPVGARVVFTGGRWVCEKGITFRTARRLMGGWAYVPASLAAGAWVSSGGTSSSV